MDPAKNAPRRLKVEPIAGEFFLRFWVESRSQPDTPHLVDLSSHRGWAQCSCKHWNCNVWPVIRDRTAERFTAASTCEHVRAALKSFLSTKVDETIIIAGQQEGEESHEQG
jgi:hypothetical protein